VRLSEPRRFRNLIVPADFNAVGPSITVSSDSQQHDSPPETKITFPCTACGSILRISAAQAGIRGPCPVCGAQILSPTPETPANAKPRRSSQTAAAFPSQRPTKDVPIRAKARIAPDSIVDQAHLQNRESAQTLKVLALFILTVCACLAAAWLLKDHLSR
jgi:hypothetical protein